MTQAQNDEKVLEEPLWLTQLVAGLPDSTQGTVREHIDLLRSTIERLRGERDEARAELAAYKRSDAFVNTGAMLDGWERTYNALKLEKESAEARLREVEKETIELCARVCEEERLDNPDNEPDAAYNIAIKHCASAIRSLAKD